MTGLRFTTTTKALLDAAEESARSLGHEWVGTDHLLLAMAISQETAGTRLAGTALTPEAVLEKIIGIRGQGEPTTGKLPYTRRLCAATLVANKLSIRHDHGHITPEHYLYALLTAKNCHTAGILADLGVDTATLSRAVAQGLNS